MQLRQIEVFHAVMISGSTVAAAAALNVTQPAVSTTLKRMQDELGLALFTTVKGRLVPTREAHGLFAQVRSLHEDLDRLKRHARALAEGRSGYVRFGAVPAVSDGIAARAIADVRTGAPDLRIAMEVLNSHELVHRLQAGRLDLACVFGALDDLPLTVLHRFEVPLLCVLPKAVALGRERIAMRDLVGMPTAAMRPTDPIGQLLERAFRDADIVLDPVVELRSSRAAIALAREGVATGFADALSLREADLREARAVPFSPPLAIELRIVALAGRAPSKAELRLADAMRDSLGVAMSTR